MVALTIRRRLKIFVVPLFLIGGLVYLGYHTIHGDRGFLAWWHLRQEITKAQFTLAEVTAIRDALERRAALLRPDNLDPDMLEEQARRLLNMSREGEIIILEEINQEAPATPRAP